MARFGKLNILVNNAGIGSTRDPDGEPLALERVTEAQWDRVLDVNTKGIFLGTKVAIPAMRQAGGGSIVNISSIAGLVLRTAIIDRVGYRGLATRYPTEPS